MHKVQYSNLYVCTCCIDGTDIHCIGCIYIAALTLATSTLTLDIGYDVLDIGCMHLDWLH